ncbi:class I SAM-dependent methyltransferase [Phormidium sp. LEGE 05292]|uniref:class I SAM-dependent methyltransferase n=1 Tax=[Phormidium] sp. LEGE 05292 TaxID=767427 RepID=UPI0018821033|nr:class I SAM-dependent methyltransferase [Phormidium sp. LEGE 05292]MBE9224308.1 class I SAM-dependent methyltransferase [Phormidium sp. LEGE 05292]
MDRQSAELLEKIRQQFDCAPYPRAPLEDFPRDIPYLYINNLVTPYYLRNQKVIHPEGKVILDAACGTGYHTLGLQVANPGAKIVATDISEASVKLARTRLEYHGFHDVEFHALAIEDLPQLGLQFDYIYANEVVYILPDPIAGLQAMKAVLKPDGIIRTNLHNSLQREHYYRSQEVFKMMGLFDRNPREAEIVEVRQTMKALKDDALLKMNTWIPDRKDEEEWFLMNYLFQGDKGFTVPEMFAALRAADLEFISMVAWPFWELTSLFVEPENLPVFLAMSLPSLSQEEKLHLFELLHPIHRLLDFWCGHPDAASQVVPPGEWTDTDWQNVKVYLHPQMQASEPREQLLACANEIKIFAISPYLPFVSDPALVMDSAVAACILPLLDGPQSMPSLVEHWRKIRPLQPGSLEPQNSEMAFETVKQILMTLEQLGYVLLECSLAKG